MTTFKPRLTANPGRKTLGITDDRLYDAVTAAADKHGCTRAELVRTIVMEWIANDEARTTPR